MTRWVAAALSLLPHQPKRSSTVPSPDVPPEEPPQAVTASRTPVRQSAARPWFSAWLFSFAMRTI
ncbi:hypothetical protein ACFQQB_61470 [Nonomuraea rubra]|uniref:hypothetical protein n=1 Tax=Nonomuraea rubra TaxID=46180 RepID=UPI0036082433